MGNSNDRQAMRSTAANRLILCMVIFYLLFLIWAILWKCSTPFVGDGSERAINLLPLRGNTMWEMQFNVAIFMPFGFYLAAWVREWSFVRKVLCTLLVSLALEVAQFAYGEEETTMMRNPEQTIGNLIDKRFFRGVQLLGTMEVCTDTATKEMIWRDGDTMYYSGGVTDADYCVLKFTACRGRYYSNFSSGDFEI